jgi:hypothetical protein
MTQSPNRLVAVVFGAVYVVVGLLGFVYTSGVDFFATSGGLILGIFEVNPFHNIAHLLIGGALLFAGVKGIAPAKATNTTIGAAYLLLGIVGLFLVGSGFNILALNAADNVLHFASAILLLGVGLMADKRTRAVSA